MHGADEFLRRNCVILKCKAGALVGHRKHVNGRNGEFPLSRNFSCVNKIEAT